LIKEQTISFTVARADQRQKAYRLVLTICLIIDAIVGLLALFVPAAVLWGLNEPGSDATAWVRLWGAMEIGLAAFSASGRSYPAEDRAVNWIGALVRLLMASALLATGGALLPVLLWQAIAGAALLWLYWRFLMSHTRGAGV
jgi:hypothetical protein